jgi:hypothetical protein
VWAEQRDIKVEKNRGRAIPQTRLRRPPGHPTRTLSREKRGALRLCRLRCPNLCCWSPLMASSTVRRMRRTVSGAGRKFGPTLDCWRYCEMPQMRETGRGSCETGLAGGCCGYIGGRQQRLNGGAHEPLSAKLYTKRTQNHPNRPECSEWNQINRL